LDTQKNMGLKASQNLHEGWVEGNELALEAWEGRESTKQIKKALHKTLKKDPESDLDIPQPQKHICMVNILI